MIRLALTILLVILPAWQVYSGFQGITQCSTDTECMMMHGGDGGYSEE